MRRAAAVFAALSVLLGISAGCGAQENQLKEGVTMQTIADQVRTDFGEWYVHMPEAVDRTSLEDLFSIDPEVVLDYAGDYSITMTSADHFLAVHAKEGYAEEVQQALENRRAQLEQTFEQYLPEPLKIARAGKVLARGNYLFLVMLGNPEGDPAQDVSRAEETINGFFVS